LETKRIIEEEEEEVKSEGTNDFLNDLQSQFEDENDFPSQELPISPSRDRRRPV
jgi:hypothetical protein